MNQKLNQPPPDILKLNELFDRDIRICPYCGLQTSIEFRNHFDYGDRPYIECLKCQWGIFLIYKNDEEIVEEQKNVVSRE